MSICCITCNGTTLWWIWLILIRFTYLPAALLLLFTFLIPSVHQNWMFCIIFVYLLGNDITLSRHDLLGFTSLFTVQNVIHIKDV